MQELRHLLRYLRKQEIKQEYACNTLSLILNALRPNLKRELFSEFAQKLDEQHHQQQDTRSGMEIIQDLKERIRSMQKRRKGGK